MKKIQFNRLFLGAVVFAAASAFSLTGMTAHASMIYVDSSSKWDTSKGLSVRPSGNVYNADGKLVGHLTDDNGNRIKQIPSSGDYEIQTRSGKILASSSASTPGVDSSRSMQITDGSEENSKGSLNSPVTTATNNGMSSSNNNVSSSNGNSSSASSPSSAATMNPGTTPTGNAGADTTRIPAPANTGSNNSQAQPQ